jgi:hypothetical protein
VPEDLLEYFRATHLAATEAFNRGDLDRALAGLPDRIEWHAVSEDPEQEILRGPEQVKEWFEGFRGVFEGWRSEPREYELVGAATILVHHVITGVSRGAGVPVEVQTFELWQFEGSSPSASACSSRGMRRLPPRLATERGAAGATPCAPPDWRAKPSADGVAR